MGCKGLYLVCIALGIVALSIPAQAGHSMSLATRSAHLALNLVDMRCPSQFERLFVQSKAALLGQGRGRRHLLEDGEVDDEFILEDEDDQALDGSRHLLGGAVAKMSLKAYRESARASAVAKAHEVCSGSPDDKGPAVFFPLHLDIDASNEPQAKVEAGPGGDAAVAGEVAEGAEGEEGDAAESPEGSEEEEGAEEEEGSEEDGKKDKKDKKKKKDEDEDEDEDAAQVVDTGPSVLMVIVLLMLVGSGIGIAGYKYLNAKASNEAPLSERASNIKKQLTRMQNALENS